MFHNKATRVFARSILLLLMAVLIAIAVGGAKFRQYLYERLDLDTVAKYYGYFAIMVTIFIVVYYVINEFSKNGK